jgi:hypothetical protein
LYGIYKFPFKISLDLQGRIRKPSKRKEGVDPLLPITPARPPKTIPPPPGPFASRRIQGSQNRAAAAVLFTPRKHQGPVPANQFPPPSPTPQRAQSPLKTGFTLSSNNSSSDTEDEVRIQLEKLDLHSQSGNSGSQSSSRSKSPSQSPRAGPHSTQRRVQRPKGGANDVWKFFEKSSGRHTCVFCKYVHYFSHSHADILFESFIGRFIVLIPAITLPTSAVPQVRQICGSTFLTII